MLKKKTILSVVFVLALFFGFVNDGWAGEKGLVAYWKFDEGKGDIVKDLSTFGNDRKGRLIGNPIWSKGKSKGALQFDGKNDAVDFGKYESILGVRPYRTISEGSVEFWFTPDKDIRGSSKFAILVGCSQAPRFSISKTGEIEALWVTDKWVAKNVHKLKSGLSSWDAGTWYHVMFSWNEKGHYLFINDTPVASDSLGGGVLAGSLNVTLGAYWNGKIFTNHFAGKLDELKINISGENTPSRLSEIITDGVVKEVKKCKGTVTGNDITYTVFYPQKRTDMPVLFHQYGSSDITTETNIRLAKYGIFCAQVYIDDYHCGYGLQDYRDAIEDILKRYGKIINKKNITIMGNSYGGAIVFGMAVRFPYLFDAVIPVFGIADFGYDDKKSWWPMIEKNSPTWGPLTKNMPKFIGDRTKYRDTRYLVRNAILGAKNNPYAHFEILHDVGDGVNKPGVHVENSRRYVSEMKQLGYTNYKYTETPQEGFVYPEDKRLPGSVWGKPIRFGHGHFKKSCASLYHFELYTLKDSILKGKWKRAPFKKKGEVFVPSFFETPYFKFHLGKVVNNCDEAVNVAYDVSSPDEYVFEITLETRLTQGKLWLMKLRPRAHYKITCMGKNNMLLKEIDAVANYDGICDIALPACKKEVKMTIKCKRISSSVKLSSNRKIIVAADKSGAFTSIQKAVDSVVDATEKNPVDIIIKPGVYFGMVTTKDWVNLIGEDKDTCILEYTSQPGEKLHKTHVIWATSNTIIKNLTLLGRIVKYCIHSDGGRAYVLNIDNVYFRREFKEGSCSYKAGSGIGLRANQHIIMRNCIIDAPQSFNLHNWNNQRNSCSITMEHCRFSGLMSISNLGSKQRDFVVLHDCVLNGQPSIKYINFKHKVKNRLIWNGQNEMELWGSGNTLKHSIKYGIWKDGKNLETPKQKTNPKIRDDSNERITGIERSQKK